MYYHPDYKSAVALQKVLLKQALEKGVESMVLVNLVKAWDTVTERKRIIHMRPKPKDQEVTKPEPKVKAAPIAEE